MRSIVSILVFSTLTFLTFTLISGVGRIGCGPTNSGSLEIKHKADFLAPSNCPDLELKFVDSGFDANFNVWMLAIRNKSKRRAYSGDVYFDGLDSERTKVCEESAGFTVGPQETKRLRLVSPLASELVSPRFLVYYAGETSTKPYSEDLERAFRRDLKVKLTSNPGYGSVRGVVRNVSRTRAYGGVRVRITMHKDPDELYLSQRGWTVTLQSYIGRLGPGQSARFEAFVDYPYQDRAWPDPDRIDARAYASEPIRFEELWGSRWK